MRYRLILVSLHSDGTDESGNQYPHKGSIRANNFLPDKDIRHGLCGTLWGEAPTSKWIHTFDNAQYRVVCMSQDQHMIYLDREWNFVKFAQGVVMFSGSYEDCMEYMQERRIMQEAA